MKRSDEDKTAANSFKSNIHDSFKPVFVWEHLQMIKFCNTYIIQVWFALIIFFYEIHSAFSDMNG